MKNLRHNRKAVSSIVGCLILILVVAIGGTIVYSYSLGKLGSLSSQSVGGLGTTTVIVEDYSWQSNGNLTLALRNTGANPFNITGVSLGTQSLRFTAVCPHGYLMLPTESCMINTHTSILTSGVVYSVYVESETAAFEFRLTFGTFGVPVGQ